MLTFGQELVLHGNIDGVGPDGVVVGWCWSPDEPDIRRVVSLAIDGLDVAQTMAEEARADLAASGYGDGAHGFTFRLAPQNIPDRESSVLTLRDIGTGRLVGSEVTVAWPRAAAASTGLVGNIEKASEDGWVSGWGWYPAEPARRVSLDILVDGLHVGSTRASLFREDLARRGIGDGRYGFSFALPWSVLATKGAMTLSVRETETGTRFGDPITLRIGRLIDVEERIVGLERQVRLLQARLGEQEAANDPAREDRAARALFRTVAAFFHEIAEAPDPAQPTATMLRHAVGSVLDGHAPLTLAIPERPAATLLLLGDATLGALHACLADLVADGVDALADIVLLDRGRHGADVALLPAIVRNLRYVRVPSGADAADSRNEITRAARGSLLVVLSPWVRPAPGAVAALLAGFEDGRDLVLAGGMVLRHDGLIEHAGYVADLRGQLFDVGRSNDPTEPDFAAPRSVEAVADLMFAVRRAAMLDVGGFPAGYADPARATVALCIALRGGNHEIAMHPAARATLVDDALRPGAAASEDDDRRLRDRWAALRSGAG